MTVDPIAGSFTGYAWGENVGWISFKNAGPIAYNVVATTVITVTRGDVNGDGTIDLLDVRLCLQIAQGYLTGTPTQRSSADVNRDGEVDETDARILSEYVIGMRSALP